MEVELHLEQLAVDLDRAARHARERVQKAGRHGASTFADESQHRRWLHALLNEMSSVVDRTARGNGAGNPRRLHVWPGYDSVRLGGSRVTFEVDRSVRETLADYGYETGLSDEGDQRAMQTGVGFPRAEKQTDRATLYFDAALAALPHDEHADTTFSVGGTHNWLALSPTLGNDPLLGFEVRTEPSSAARHHSFPTIELDPSRPLEWGNAVAAAVRSVCGETPQSFWPLPARRGGEPQAAYSERLEKEFVLPAHRDIRNRLYSLWLIGCFVPDPARVLLEGRGATWLDGLIEALRDVEPQRARRVEGLRELELNAANGAELPLARTHYTTWGVMTIPYPVADTRSGDDGEESDDLGSGMLLANFDVPYWYYFAIRQWIASYYLSLRQHESSFLMAERESHKAALYAEKELRRQLSHAVGTELTYVEFLASVAAKSIAEEHFNPRPGVVVAGVEHADVPADEFHRGFGDPSPMEQALANIIRRMEGPEGVRRDVSLAVASLAAVPADEGRKVISGLAHEVARVALENRALVRVDDAAVVAEFERDGEATNDVNAVPLVELLGRALLVSLTVYFRKAFPEFQEASEAVCLHSAEALFGDAEASVTLRRAIGQTCAKEWRAFVAGSYQTTGFAPPYPLVRSWVAAELARHSRLELQLPDPGDTARLKPGGGEFAPLVTQAWLTEALLNALKHSRPVEHPFHAAIRVDWLCPDAVLMVANTATPAKAQEVSKCVEAAARGASSIKDGHQGLAFLGYAAKNLFIDRRLYSDLQPETHMLRLRVN
ncbi:MAG TPA: hypothetical protein VE974_17950 [Thermoanaerobaculia bacterium]|nr:hypothetical protein [Thermoanaerobaculia bacterium]